MNPDMRRPEAGEHHPYYARYIERVQGNDVLAILTAQGAETAAFLATIGEEKSLHRYAEGKWSIREIIGHLTDAEQVFCYRALTFARGDVSELPGFEEGDYVVSGEFDRIPLAKLAERYAAQRRVTLALFETLPPEAWSRTGTANGAKISVRALAWALAGHELHHLGVVRERYL